MGKASGAHHAGSTNLFVNGQHVNYIKATVQPDKTTRVEIIDTFVATGIGDIERT
jgi:hypothetical protein